MFAQAVSTFAKRLLDFTIASLGIIVLSPLMLIIAVAIRWRMGNPVLFRQRRAGYHARPFTMIKFRTMTVSDSAGTQNSDASRLTPLGALLRRYSLDEFPQLWSVVKGEMSLVGPRPLFIEYLDFYTADQNRRHEVLPGMTGWAQVNGRNELDWERKFALDVWYVEHQSFSLDLRILALTFWRVLTHRGISQPGHATAERFDVQSQ